MLALTRHEVSFVVIGGGAGVLLVDCSEENLPRLLSPLQAMDAS